MKLPNMSVFRKLVKERLGMRLITLLQYSVDYSLNCAPRVCREVFKARERKNPKKYVAMKKVLMDNEKEGVSYAIFRAHRTYFPPNHRITVFFAVSYYSIA